jgi:FkbM family methyltransferase
VELSLKKRLALQAVAARLPIPEQSIDRVAELIHLRQLIDLLSINCVLDVGANKGQFASELRGIGFQGWIVSFEPLESEFLQLTKAFGGDRFWRGFQVALGEKSGLASLNVVSHLTVMSSLLESTLKFPDMRTQNVEVKRLDEIFDAVVAGIDSPRVLLKMDTQGYDLKVFAGSLGCLNHVQALQSELSVIPIYKEMPHYLQALDTYERSGFVLFNLSVVSRTGDGGLQELNCFMRRQ